uniref:Uncharacterized protein n=1 Tax=Oryza sativa subsp. japonica TaxID=39947 RepID=Q5YLZ1_ORYSJ|nr:hypothetical protein [Oryza sativa Japonica Group]
MVDKNDQSDTGRVSNGQPRSHVAPVSAGSGGRRSFQIQRGSESLRSHPKPPAELAKGGLRGLPVRSHELRHLARQVGEGPYRVIGVPRPGSVRLATGDGTELPNPWNIEHLRRFYP